VMVTSSPVWTLLLALKTFLFGAENILYFFNGIMVAVAGTASYLLAWGLLKPRRWHAKTLTLLLPLTVLAVLADSSLLGMETPLAIALLLLAALAFVRSSPMALPLLAVASFTRYEMAALYAVAGLVCIMTRTARKHGAITATIITGILTAWLIIEFGTIFPHALKVKGSGYGLSAAQTYAMLRPKPAILISFTDNLLILALLLFAYWLGEAVLNRRRRDTERLVALGLALWGCALSALYIWRNTFIFAWYIPLVYVPFLVGTLLMIFIDQSTLRRILASFLLLSTFLATYQHLELLVRSVMTKDMRELPLLDESGRVHTYLAVGRALHEVCPDSQLMTSEIGALGYSFQGQLFDGFGLASPDAIKYHPMQVPRERSSSLLGAIPTGFALEKKADLIVTYDIFGEAVLASPQIRSEYDDLRFSPVLPEDASAGRKAPWGIKTLHVLVKRDGACTVSKVSESLTAILKTEPQVTVSAVKTIYHPADF